MKRTEVLRMTNNDTKSMVFDVWFEDSSTVYHLTIQCRSLVECLKVIQMLNAKATKKTIAIRGFKTMEAA
jgi:hypothetical protein